MNELEAQKNDLEISILQAQLENPMLSYEQIVYGISRFKGGRVDDPVYQRRIIDNFVNSVYLYDDKLVLTFNYKDGTKTVSLTDVQGYLKNVIGSDLVDYAPPIETIIVV